MLTIRFNRTGRHNRPHFRVVLQEHTVAPGGRHVEMLGSYDPRSKQAVLKAERIQYWIGQGAQVSESAWNLMLKQGVVQGDKKAIKMKRPVKKEASVAEAAPAAEAPAETAAAAEAPADEGEAAAPAPEEAPSEEAKA